MSLRTRLRLAGESLLEEGEPDQVLEQKRKAYDEAVRPARLEAARRMPKWTEIESDLVPRNRGRWLVSASSDHIYQPVSGVVFASYSVTVIADRTALWFYVDDEGELHFFERLPFTWTQHLEKRAARELAKAAPKPRRE